MKPTSQLVTWDYITMSLCIFLTSFIGIYHSFKNRRSNNLKEFLVSNRNISIVPLILSAGATQISSTGLLGFTAEAYSNGMPFICWPLGVILIIPMANYLFIPVLYNLNKSTIYEYLGLRFNGVIEVCASLLTCIHLIFFASANLYAPSLALNQVTGVEIWTFVLIAGGVSIIYTAMGGFKAVVWADVSQFLLMIIIMLLVLIKGIFHVGGIDVIWERLTNGERATTFIWNENSSTQYTVWMLTIAGTFQRFPMTLLNQEMMQRYLSNPTLQKARMSYIGVALSSASFLLMEIAIGLTIYAYYFNCDPLLNGQIKKRDQLLPFFAVNILSFANGLSGAFIAGLLCASISTVSSQLNSLTNIVISNFVIPTKPTLSVKTILTISKILVICFGCLCTGLVAAVMKFGIMKLLFDVVGLLSGPIICVFIIGMLLPWATVKGALVGVLFSVIIPWWSWIGKTITSPPMPHAPYSIEGCYNITTAANSTLVYYSKVTERDFLQQIYSMNSSWYPFCSTIVGVIVSAVYSATIESQDISQVDPNLFFPFVRDFVLKQKLKRSNSKRTTNELNQIPVVAPLLQNSSNDVTATL